MLGFLSIYQGGTMQQVHRRYSYEEVAFLLEAYSQGLITRVEVEEVLDLGKTSIFALWREHHGSPEAFTVPASLSGSSDGAKSTSSQRRIACCPN